jgi:hypothetical protein
LTWQGGRVIIRVAREAQEAFMFSNKVRKAAIAEIEKYVREIRSRRTETFVSQGEICSVVKPPVYTFGVVPPTRVLDYEELDCRAANPVVRRVFRDA